MEGAKRRRWNHQKEKENGGMSMKRVFENDDLVEEILLHVPAIHVFGVRRVCKRWNNLISDVGFRRRHHTSHVVPLPTTSRSSVLFQSYDSTMMSKDKLVALINPPDAPLPTNRRPFSFNFDYIDDPIANPIPPDSYFHVRGSSNGLLLVALLKKGGHSTAHFVCNPLTRDYKRLPPAPNNYGPTLRMMIAFDPSISLTYKVIAVIGIPVPGTKRAFSDYQLHVYTPHTSTWNITQTYTHDYSCFSNISTFRGLNNIIYFGLPDPTLTRKDFIAVDLNSVSFRLLPPPLPPYTIPQRSRCYHMVFEGSLYLVERFDLRRAHKGAVHYRIWAMKDDTQHSDWELKFSFQVGNVIKILYIRTKSDQQLQIFVCLMGSPGPLYDKDHLNNEGLELVDVPDFNTTIPTYCSNIFAYHPTLFPLVSSG